MAVALRHLPVTAEVLVRYWTAPCEIGYVETSTENGIFLSTLNFLRQYHSTNVPHAIVFVFLYCYKQDKRAGELPSKAELSAMSWTMVLKGTSTMFSNI